MPAGQFFKDNFVLLIGLSLPVLLMAGFMVVSSLPAPLTDPPQHDLVFSVVEYMPASPVPISVTFSVEDGVLKAQYTRLKPTPDGSIYNHQWSRLYLYEARTQTLRELPFGFPEDMEKIESTRKDIVEATKNLVLDTRAQSPDGYEMTHTEYRRRGLVNELFWHRSNYSGEMRLKKGLHSIRLSTGPHTYPFYYGSVQFVGWVTGTR